MSDIENIRFRNQRLRSSEVLRNLTSETKLSKDYLIFPIFIKAGNNIKIEIKSMPDIYQLSIDNALKEISSAIDVGIKSFILFGIPENKDEIGSSAFANDGIIQLALREIKKHFPDILVITDLCMCEYTSHGHCGVIKNENLDNDATLKLLNKQALSLANNGADMIAPSGMIDGVVESLRYCLDNNGFKNLPILSYSAKYASSFYGPFREAAESEPGFGDRKKYQMNPANKKEAIKEVLQDISEGADIVMIKPALSYLDVINELKNKIHIPIAAYSVSGEYSMIKAASKMGWIDEKSAMNELLLSIKRAGADMIITYFAKDFAKNNK